MPYPFPNPTQSFPYLTQVQSINALAEAEASILSCMSSLLYLPANAATRVPVNGTLLANLANLAAAGTPLQEVASLLRQVLCSFACKEEAIADILSSLACMLAVEKGLMEEEECCPCFKRNCQKG